MCNWVLNEKKDWIKPLAKFGYFGEKTIFEKYCYSCPAMGNSLDA